MPNNENARDPGQRRIPRVGTSHLPAARARDFRAFGVAREMSTLRIGLTLWVAAAASVWILVARSQTGWRSYVTNPHDPASGFAITPVEQLAWCIFLGAIAVALIGAAYIVWLIATLPGKVGDQPQQSIAPGTMNDGTPCLHIGETATYCTKCWTNLCEARVASKASA
jgi:ABC-type uncharacterized transport system permease subunit